MKIAIDIHHPADVNFFKNSINILIKKGVSIELIVRSRGSIVPILQKELPYISFKIIGKQHSAIYKKILGGIKRELELLFYLNKVKFDAGIEFGPEICYTSRVLGKPSIAFTDDYEYKITFYLSKFAATYLIIPDYIPATGKNISKYKGFKELAYLHPKYFRPNKNIIEYYGLKPNEYVFIREITNRSLNYRGYLSNLHESVQHLKDMGYKIVLSLEDKSLIKKFNDDYIILNEPIEDMHSLLSFATLTISSGDTMARESCLVGTPTIYTGGRDMSVNKELIENGCMFKADSISDITHFVKYITENNMKNKTMEIIDYNIKHKWDDVTEIIVRNIMGLMV